MPESSRIYPSAAAEYYIEKHYRDHRHGSLVLYWLLLGLFIIAFVLLFIVRIDISVRSSGLFRSARERTEIRSLVAATVEKVLVKENDHVSAGEPLVQLLANAVNDKQGAVISQKNELLKQQQDLQQLLRGKYQHLRSRLYMQEQVVYNSKLHEITIRLNVARRNFNRYKELYQEKIISTAEFEKYEADYRTAQNELSLLREQQRDKWQSELTALNIQLKDLQARHTAYREEQGLYTISSPTSGYIQQLKGIAPGSLLTAGELIGEVSPDSGLLAEIYVSPKNIGYLYEGMTVRMQIDAFDYNVWGMVPGKVRSISRDIFIQDGQPLFKVWCEINKPVLRLKNGYQGMIKKGMTVQARFLVTRRTLFQLLFDKADDWLNPNLIRNEH
ncbi:HlyD family secretion protein [Longitalea luteola]|uniref:HlyD family secretion protein n=1 Tax=Longitalea luteola TaxID=2812563 RepID=UPI001A9676DD|nr:HlyD family efflux transporter periplasmic adaptor subunit [Longitalea luteola]